MEAGRGVPVNALMVPAMTGNLMAGVGDSADQAGIVHGNLADDEERRFDVALGQEIEQPARRAVQSVAIVSLQSGRNGQAHCCLDAVVLFNIKAKNYRHIGPDTIRNCLTWKAN